MAKKNPDSVVEHRISLQTKQSEQLDALITAVQVKAFAGPVVEVLSSPVALAAIIGVILAAASKYLGIDWEDQVEGKTVEQIRDWMETQNLVVGGIFAIIGGLLGGPWGAGIGFAAGVGTVEGIEHITEEGPAWASTEQTEENRRRTKALADAYVVKALSELNIFASKLKSAL